ncbi:MAG: HAMP domain-containing sensor histidine kinase [Casimicrobiaceae bacterium]
MRYRLSLRTRLVAAILLIVTAVSVACFYGAYQLVELLEDELMEARVKRELGEFARQFALAPTTPPPNAVDLKSYVLRPGDALPPAFPAWLLTWPAGHYDVNDSGDKELFAGREDVGDTRLYLVLDIEYVERLESRLLGLALIAITGAWLAAIAAGWLLARRIMRPVSRLAEKVAALNPSDTTQRLGEEFRDREIGLIAAAFDTYLERLDEFVARERAFTDEASHELRTPLAVVVSAVQLLQEDPALGDRRRARVARIGRAARQMQDLVEALLFLAREDGGWKAEPCALDEVLEEIADAYRDAVAEKVSLHCEIAARRTILIPRGMAECVVSNLVGNAILHTEKGRIDLRLEADRIVVQDSGVGIPPGDLQQIFVRRYRNPHSRGLGLGLYLVKRICDRLGWRIEVRSAPGAGARFDVMFAPGA